MRREKQNFNLGMDSPPRLQRPTTSLSHYETISRVCPLVSEGHQVQDHFTLGQGACDCVRLRVRERRMGVRLVEEAGRAFTFLPDSKETLFINSY